MFWKTINPLLSDKFCVEDRIGISQNQMKLLNNFFSNIVKNLNISRYSEVDSVARNMTDPTLRAKLKCKDHLSIPAITSQCEAKTFCFTAVNTEDIKKEIFKLSNKASQVLDIPVKAVQDNVDIFADFLCENINSAFKYYLFPACLKPVNMMPHIKKVRRS